MRRWGRETSDAVQDLRRRDARRHKTQNLLFSQRIPGTKVPLQGLTTAPRGLERTSGPNPAPTITAAQHPEPYKATTTL
jgi:hypothetical protein